MSIPYSIFNVYSSTDANAPVTPGLVNPTNGNTYYSKMWTGRNADGAGLTVFYSGTLTGTFTLWMTDKPNPSEADDTDWWQDTSFAPTNPSGSAGKFRDDTANAKSYRKRLKYVHTSGSGTITGFVTPPRNS